MTATRGDRERRATAERARRRFSSAMLIALLGARSVGAQDFAAPAPPGPAEAPLRFLESALPAPEGAPSLEGLVLRWNGLDELVTRAVALGFGARSARVAAGLSQTGEPEVGWTCVALAAGAALDGIGLGVRAAGRRERDPNALGAALGAGIGAEVGFGAWLVPSPGVTVWTSAPQVWRRGTLPPLSRPLAWGVRLDSDPVRGWILHRSPSRGARDTGELSGGVAFVSGPALAWIEARERPLRGGLGIAARARSATIAAQVDGHPVLGETVRLSVSFGAARSAPAPLADAAPAEAAPADAPSTAPANRSP